MLRPLEAADSERPLGVGEVLVLLGSTEAGLFAVILVNGVFSFLQEYRAERAVQALQRLLPRRIVLRRAGTEGAVPATTLVPGDVVRLGEGDHVPADAHLLTADGLRVDQSALTGESHPAFKRPATGDHRAGVPRLERYELVFAGTSVVAGDATAVVVATGMATEIGAVAHLTQATAASPSPLEREMVRATRVVTVLALAIGGAFLLLGVGTGLLPLGDAFVFALGVIVANVPEGLLPTMTLALALGVQRMARRRSLVRRLSAVETLGATTVICTDKTGTLTEGRMATRAVWTAAGVRAAGELTGAGDEVRELFRAAVLGSLATAERGDPTKTALVVTAATLGLDAAVLRASAPLLAAHPFDSFRKRMTLVRAVDGAPVACVKGAPRETVALCTALRAGAGIAPLTETLRASLLRDHDRLAAEGLRLLAVATRPLAPALLTDDNFATIVAAVREGRAIYANMGKFVRYIFASNVPELVPFLAFVLFRVPLPLTVMQILAVDLGTDLLPALALGSEPPEPDVMDHPPRRRAERLLGAGRLLHAYAFLGVAEAVLSLAGFFWVYWLAGWRPGHPMAATGDLYQRATTMTLAGIVAAQVGNVFACRTERASVFGAGLLRNRLVLVGIAAEVVILLGLILLPPLRLVFGLAPLAPAEWGLLLVFPPVVLGLEEARKWIVGRWTSPPAGGAAR